MATAARRAMVRGEGVSLVALLPLVATEAAMAPVEEDTAATVASPVRRR